MEDSTPKLSDTSNVHTHLPRKQYCYDNMLKEYHMQSKTIKIVKN